MSLKVFNRVHVQNFGNIATFNTNIFLGVFWISLIRMDSLLLDFVTLHQSIEEWGHPCGWGAKQLSLTVSTSNTESIVLTVPCYQNSAWWIPQTVKDVGGNPKDPLIWISAYMIYMAYTYKGGVYVGKEAPSGTKGPT